MAVSDTFNLRSRAYMGFAGLLGLTAAFLDLSQAVGAQGLTQYYFYAHGLTCLIFGGALAMTSLSWSRQQAGAMVDHRDRHMPHLTQPARRPLSELEPIAQRRKARLIDGTASLAFAALASQFMTPAEGGDLLKWTFVSYGFGSALGVTYDTARLHFMNRKAGAPKL